MRWFVEVSTIGDAVAPSRLCVDAEQWQPALEEARRLLKDVAPLSKFSIEVLDDGYRALNPALRTRYVIRRAPDDAALTDEANLRQSTLPPPGDLARNRTTLPAQPSVAPSVTVPSDAVPPAPPPPSRQAQGQRLVTPEPPAVAPRQAEPASSPAATEHSWLSRRRLEEATAESPLVYCEVAYVVAPGLSRDAVERVLLQRFREVCAELEGQVARKYVQLGVFDHEFEGRPLGPPLATLSWKDWRGVPAVGFPAFGEPAPRPSSLPPRIPGWTAPQSEPPSAPVASRPSSSLPPSSDSVRVIRSVPVGAPDEPGPTPLPEIETPDD